MIIKFKQYIKNNKFKTIFIISFNKKNHIF